MTLLKLAEKYLTVEELEAVIAKKKEKSNPKPLTKIELIDRMHEEFLTGGENPKLYPPRYESE